MSVDRFQRVVLEVLAVQLMGNVAELMTGLPVSTGYQTRALRSESESLSVSSAFDENSPDDIFSHSSELDYHGLHKLSHRPAGCKIVYTALFPFTELNYSTITRVPYLQ